MAETINMKRRKVIVPVSREWFETMFTTGVETHVKCIKGLPVTAIFDAMSYDFSTDSFWLRFYSPDFEEVPESEPYPVVDIYMTELDGI